MDSEKTSPLRTLIEVVEIWALLIQRHIINWIALKFVDLYLQGKVKRF